MGGAGFVVRDCNNKLILASNMPLFGAVVRLTEMMAAWHAVRCAVPRFRCSKLWIHAGILVFLLLSWPIRKRNPVPLGREYLNRKKLYYAISLELNAVRWLNFIKQSWPAHLWET